MVVSVKAGEWDSDPAGNRLAAPVEVQGEHFFYKTEQPGFAEEDVAIVVAAARKHIEEFGIGPSEIQSLSRRQLEAAKPGCAEAINRMASLSHGRKIKVRADEPDILVCEWARPHTDDSFAGLAFVSYVLDTGEHPYVMQTFHTRIQEGLPKLVSTTRVISKGDGFVFDPTTPHMAAPKYPGADQLLVLLQFEVFDGSEQDRSELLRQFPPVRSDRDGEHELDM